MYKTCSELAIFMYWTCNSMNNLLSYCGCNSWCKNKFFCKRFTYLYRKCPHCDEMKHVRSLKTHAEKCEEYRKFVKNGTDCVICSRSFESKGTTALYMHLTRSHKNELLEFGKEGWYFICILKYLEKILKGSLDSMPSPSTSVKIKIMDGKVCLR